MMQRYDINEKTEYNFAKNIVKAEISKEYIEKHNGNIEIRNEKAKKSNLHTERRGGNGEKSDTNIGKNKAIRKGMAKCAFSTLVVTCDIRK